VEFRRWEEDDLGSIFELYSWLAGVGWVFEG
jgi:hypothetical protein